MEIVKEQEEQTKAMQAQVEALQRKKEEDKKMDREIEEMREKPWQRKGKYKEKKNIGKSVNEGRLVEIDGETDSFWDL